MTPSEAEAWTAVAAERNEMIDFWDSLGKPVFVLTGDCILYFFGRRYGHHGPMD